MEWSLGAWGLGSANRRIAPCKYQSKNKRPQEITGEAKDPRLGCAPSRRRDSTRAAEAVRDFRSRDVVVLSDIQLAHQTPSLR